jgi:peptidoglycan/xylan/chitin deacetylase (PgdA/CDA1 family)
VLTAKVIKASQFTPPTSISKKKSEISLTTPLVLLYHRVADDLIDSQLLAVSPKNFDFHMKELAENYRVLPFYELIEELRQGVLKPDTVALTFDDGYLDNLTNAVPLLEKYKLHATIFISSGMVGSEEEFWWDALERVFLTGNTLPPTLSVSSPQGEKTWDLTTAKGRLKAYDEICDILRSDSFEDIQKSVKDLYEWAGIEQTARSSHRILNESQLQKLAESHFIEIGSHSVTHTRLSILSPEKQQQEIRESKQQLEAFIKKPVRLFSYPYGTNADFNHETVSIVSQEGYEAGIANIQGNIVAPINLYAIPRRLVRNWSGDVFAKWMKEEDKGRLEAESISTRSKNIIEYQLSTINNAYQDNKI